MVLPSRVAALFFLACVGCERAPNAVSVEEVRPERAPAPRAELGPPPPELLEVLRLNAAGRIEPARAVAERYVREHPDDGRGRVMLGMTDREAGHYRPAADEFTRALELSPDYWLTHRYLGECLMLLGELDGARREYAALAAADPTEPQGPHGLGLVALERGELEAAEQHFRSAVALFEALRRADPRRHRARAPELAETHARLADVHFARDEYEAARDELLRATALEPGHLSAFYALSQVHRRLGDDEAAERALARYEAGKAALLRRAGEGQGE